MKPEVNAVLQEVKAQMNSMDNAKPQPVDINSLRLPDFKQMSIMEATKWCVENGITVPSEIAKITGKSANTVSTALWKMRNPKRVKVLARRARKVKELKIMLIKDATKTKAKAKPTKIKKPKIENGLYEDGMETPWRDALQRRGVFPEIYVPPEINTNNELMAENRRLKILVEHYESLLFKGVK